MTWPLSDTHQKTPLQELYPHYRIGRGSYGGLEVYTWGEGATLQVGAFCSFAQGVKIFIGGEHRTDWVTTYPFNVLWEAGRTITGHPKTKGDVIIGNDVWIGTEAFVLSGNTIGDGAVIGARAVVTKDVEPYAVVAGNPARMVKKRFDEETIERLLRIQWWNWEDEKIGRALPLLLSQNIRAFLDAAEANTFDRHPDAGSSEF
jgi:acetyltransferase-like isoleucine patch superfamily enzyme